MLLIWDRCEKPDAGKKFFLGQYSRQFAAWSASYTRRRGVYPSVMQRWRYSCPLEREPSMGYYMASAGEHMPSTSSPKFVMRSFSR